MIKKISSLLVMAGVASAMLLLSPVGGANAQTPTKPVAGYVYTSINGEGMNEVVQLSRYNDGSLGNEKTYPTYGKGGANHSAPAKGDYDAQGQLKIVGNFLLTTNPGDNSVSVFALDRKTGNLKFMSKSSSEGQFPISIAHMKVASDPNAYWIVIGNQWATPTVLYEGDKLRRYPNDDFFKQDLSKPDASDKDRSTELFRLDASTGVLTHVRTIEEHARKWGGPASVVFSPDGKKLGVTTWGVPHFFAKNPILAETRPSRVYVYDFDSKTGETTNSRFFEKDGVIGSVGFNWSANSDLLYVSNFNLTTDLNDHGLTVLKDDGASVKMVSNHLTGQPNDIDEACWTTVGPNGDILYVVSYVTNVVTSYAIDKKTGMIGKRLKVTERGDYAPHEDTKDIMVTADNKYAYALGSFFSYSVNSYNVTPNGPEYKAQYTLERTKHMIGKGGGHFDLGGIDGFDLK